MNSEQLDEVKTKAEQRKLKQLELQQNQMELQRNQNSLKAIKSNPDMFFGYSFFGKLTSSPDDTAHFGKHTDLCAKLHYNLNEYLKIIGISSTIAVPNETDKQSMKAFMLELDKLSQSVKSFVEKRIQETRDDVVIPTTLREYIKRTTIELKTIGVLFGRIKSKIVAVFISPSDCTNLDNEQLFECIIKLLGDTIFFSGLESSCEAFFKFIRSVQGILYNTVDGFDSGVSPEYREFIYYLKSKAIEPLKHLLTFIQTEDDCQTITTISNDITFIIAKITPSCTPEETTALMSINKLFETTLCTKCVKKLHKLAFKRFIVASVYFIGRRYMSCSLGKIPVVTSDTQAGSSLPKGTDAGTTFDPNVFGKALQWAAAKGTNNKEGETDETDESDEWVD